MSTLYIKCIYKSKETFSNLLIFFQFHILCSKQNNIFYNICHERKLGLESPLCTVKYTTTRKHLLSNITKHLLHSELHCTGLKDFRNLKTGGFSALFLTQLLLKLFIVVEATAIAQPFCSGGKMYTFCSIILQLSFRTSNQGEQFQSKAIE